VIKLPLFIYLLKNKLNFTMVEESTVYYIYMRNGKECFTSNEDLAHKRADEGTEIRLKTIKNIT